MFGHAESVFVFRRPIEGMSVVAIDEGTKMSEIRVACFLSPSRSYSDVTLLYQVLVIFVSECHSSSHHLVANTCKPMLE